MSSPEKDFIMKSHNHSWNLVNVDGDLYYVDTTWLDNNVSILEPKEVVGADGSISYEYVVRDSSTVFLEKKDNGITWYLESTNKDHINSIDNAEESHTPLSDVPKYMGEFGKDVEYFANSANPYENFVSINDSDNYIDNHMGIHVEDAIDETEEKVEDISDKKVTLGINGKVLTCSAGALVGVMGAVGAAVAVHNKKEKERRRRRINQAYFDSMSYDSYGFSQDYTSDYSSSQQSYSSHRKR